MRRSPELTEGGSAFPKTAMQQTPAILTAALALLATLAAPARADTVPSEPRKPHIEVVDQAPRGQPPSLFRQDLEKADTLGVGRIARDVDEHLPAVEALSTYLGSRIAHLGYARARAVLARDNAEMADFLRRGIVDIVSETPLSAVHLVEAAGASIILRERRKKSESYASVIFVRADSPVRTLADLRGRRIAFEDRGSTTACLLPLAEIKRAGLQPVPLEDSMSPPVENAVGYYFTLSESSIATSVARRVADAGALSDEEWRSLQHEQPQPPVELRIIHTSDPVPRAFVLTGPGVSPAQRDGLRKLLLAMEGEDDGSDVLKRYGKVDGFDAIDGELEARIRSLQATHSLLREEMD